MISEWFLDLFAGIVEWFASLFGDGDVWPWLTGMSDFISDLLENAAGLGAWFPFVLFGLVAGTYFTLWFLFWGLKFLRWLWGLTPFSGGS